MMPAAAVGAADAATAGMPREGACGAAPDANAAQVLARRTNASSRRRVRASREEPR